MYAKMAYIVRKGVSFHDFTEEIKEQKVACFGKKASTPEYTNSP
jgi:hypothetical protein